MKIQYANIQRYDNEIKFNHNQNLQEQNQLLVQDMINT